VVGGSARGRRLQSPAGSSTRPTSDRVREAVFNSLYSLGTREDPEGSSLVEGSAVVDLFAGTGAMGIEALSRGASRVVFVENDPAAAAVIRANLDSTCLGPAELVRRDVLAWLERSAPPFDLAFCDPPYRYEHWPELLALVPARLLVAESDRPIGPAEGWDVTRSRRYGGTVVELLCRKR